MMEKPLQQANGPPSDCVGGSADGGDAARRSAFILVDPVVQYTEFLDRCATAHLVSVCVLINSVEKCRDEASEERVVASFRRRETRFDHVVGAPNVVAALDRLQYLAERAGLRYVGAAAIDSETGQDSVDILASCLGLPHNDLATLRARRDKVQMKRAVRAAGLRCAQWTTCDRLSALPAALAPHRFPVVVKAPQGTGSIQVWICGTPEEARRAVETILSKRDFFGRHSLFALIEEYLPGTEYAANLFAAGGEVHIESIWRYDKGRSASGCPVYRRAELLDCTAPHLEPLARYARAVARAVGLRIGPGHLELKWEEGASGGDGGPCMVEIASRVSGGWKSSMTALVVPDWDPFQAALDVYRGVPPALPPSFRPQGAVLHVFLRAPRPGTVRRVRGLAQIRALPTYFWDLLYVAEGARVRATADLFSHPASVFLVQRSSNPRFCVLSLSYSLFLTRSVPRQTPGVPRARLDEDERAGEEGEGEEGGGAHSSSSSPPSSSAEEAGEEEAGPWQPTRRAAAGAGAGGEEASGHPNKRREPPTSSSSSSDPSPTPSSPPGSPTSSPSVACPAPLPPPPLA
eukprot:tig00000144_g9185.t1